MYLKSLIVLFCACIIFSCKKDKKTASPNPEPESLTELSQPFFQQDYGSSYDYDDIGTNPLTLLSSGNFIVSANECYLVDDKLQITKISPAGSLIWQQNIVWGYKYKSGNCFETTSGDLIALGAIIDQSDWTHSKAFIVKLNSATGDTIWTRAYGYNYIDKAVVGCEDANHNYWVLDINHQDNRATFLHIGSNGDSLTSVLNTEVNMPQYRDAMVTSNKKIVIVGESGNIVSGKTPVYICRYSNGLKDFSSHIALTGFDNIRVKDVCETSDGGYVVAGECFNAANTALRYGFLLKTDANGNMVWEKELTQNNTGIYSCVEKQADVFYLGIGGSGSAQLYKYDLNTLSSLTQTTTSVVNDLQLLKTNNKLYRAILGYRPNYFGAVSLKAYTIN